MTSAHAQFACLVLRCEFVASKIEMDFKDKSISEIGIWLKEESFSDKIVDVFKSKFNTEFDRSI